MKYVLVGGPCEGQFINLNEDLPWVHVFEDMHWVGPAAISEEPSIIDEYTPVHIYKRVSDEPGAPFYRYAPEE